MSMGRTVFWGALGVGFVLRGFFRPHRAVVKEGAIVRCAGSNQFGVCDPSDTIETAEGEPVFSTGPAEVVAVGGYYVNLLVQNDAVILMYEGLTPEVEVGQHVGSGQRIGTSDGRLHYSVTQYKPNGVAEFVPPSAWLAVRGMELVKNNSGSEALYCAGGRDIVVPSENKRACDLKAPRKAKFAMLPVSVELQ